MTPVLQLQDLLGTKTCHCYYCSVAKSCLTLCNSTDCSTPGCSVLSLLKFMSIELVILSNHPILCCHLLLLPSVFPRIRIFSSESVLRIKWPKYWSFSFSFSISPSNEYSGLISFQNDWFDLLAVQETQESSPTSQLKASVLWYSALFMVQLSYICT